MSLRVVAMTRPDWPGRHKGDDVMRKILAVAALAGALAGCNSYEMDRGFNANMGGSSVGPNAGGLATGRGSGVSGSPERLPPGYSNRTSRSFMEGEDVGPNAGGLATGRGSGVSGMRR